MVSLRLPAADETASLFPRLGTPVVAVWLAARRAVQAEGVVDGISAEDGRRLEVRLARRWLEFPPEPPLLVAGPRGARRTARTRSHRTYRDVAVFEIASPWQAWDPRRAKRHPCSIAVTLESNGGFWQAPATLKDVSVTGVGFVVASLPPSPFLRLHIDEPRSTLTCKIVRVTRLSGAGWAVGAMFRELGALESFGLREEDNDHDQLVAFRQQVPGIASARPATEVAFERRPAPALFGHRVLGTS